jgi:hypothetical protein
MRGLNEEVAAEIEEGDRLRIEDVNVPDACQSKELDNLRPRRSQTDNTDFEWLQKSERFQSEGVDDLAVLRRVRIQRPPILPLLSASFLTRLGDRFTLNSSKNPLPQSKS